MRGGDVRFGSVIEATSDESNLVPRTLMSDKLKVRSGEVRKGEARQSLLLIQGVIQVIRDLKSFRSMSIKEADELTLSGTCQMTEPTLIYQPVF